MYTGPLNRTVWRPVLSFETAQRALEIQERAVDQLRSRTSALLTASSLIASFFGGEAIKRGSGLGPFGVRGLVAMAVSIGLCVYVLIPKQSFAFNLNARETYERLRDAPSDTAVHERLLAWLAECTDRQRGGDCDLEPHLPCRDDLLDASTRVLGDRVPWYGVLTMPAPQKFGPPPRMPESRGGFLSGKPPWWERPPAKPREQRAPWRWMHRLGRLLRGH